MGIRQTCAPAYAVVLRVYLLLLAFAAFCGAVTLWAEGLRLWAPVPLGVCAALCGAAVLVPWRRRRVSYTRVGGCLTVEQGLFVRRVRILYRDDVRAAELTDDPIGRRLGLCNVTFFTGGGRVCLRGLTVEDGRRLRYLFGGGAEA